MKAVKFKPTKPPAFMLTGEWITMVSDGFNCERWNNSIESRQMNMKAEEINAASN